MVSLEEFKKLLVQKNYEKLQEELNKMANGPWPGEIIYDFVGHTNSFEVVVGNWSPLVMAAIADDDRALNMVIEHFRDVKMVDAAILVIRECLKHLENKQCDIPKEQLDKAYSLLLIKRDEYFPRKDRKYLKEEKLSVVNILKDKISALNSIDELLLFYNQYSTKEYLEYRRHSIFDGVKGLFQKDKEYTHSKQQFI